MLFRNKNTNEYEFPTMTLYHGDNFQIGKYRLFVDLTKEKFKIYFDSDHPEFCLTRPFHDYEQSDPKNKGLNGVRTFYYPAHHFRGTPQVFANKRHPYDDFVFATKLNFNQVTTEEYYHGVIHALKQF